MIVVMQPEATEADIEGVTEALVRHGLVPSVSRGAECTVIGAIGDVDAVGDLAQFSLLPGVDKT
ncbi:MAG TPA: 3-deoxy-D-arabino-heptulosonate 7-phosphate synthase, partial [Acidimicrobiia bacterium]|nr:3-deoxy-D-arabino-heptulosonate 7-phosphate synthase [Acidimicrobiia bacterium]